MSTRYVVIVALSTALAGPSWAQGARSERSIGIMDLLRLRFVSEIDVSRDGTTAVYVVRSIIESDDAPVEDEPGERADDGYAGGPWTNASHIFAIDLVDQSAAPRRLTWGDRTDGQVRISPDGRVVAFVRGDDVGQIWILPLDGGEARQLTDLEHGAGDPRWSPDGSRLAFSSPVPFDEIEGATPWPSERWQGDRQALDGEGAPPDAAAGEGGPEGAADGPSPDGDLAELRRFLAANEARSASRVIGRLRFLEEFGLAEEMQAEHVSIVDVDGTSAEPRRLTSGFVAIRDARWMPDGRRLVAVRQLDTRSHPDDTFDHEVVVVDADTGAIEPLMSEPGWDVRRPAPSGDGSVVAFLATPSASLTFGPTQLGVVTIPVGGGVAAPTWLTSEDGFDLSVDDYAWMPARSSLLFSGAHHGGFPLMTMGVGLLEPAVVVDRIDAMTVGVNAFGAGGGAIVYAATHPGRPSTLRVRDARGDRVLEDLNPWLDGRDVAIPEERWIDRPDGTRVQCWIMRPTTLAPGERAPLVVEIHGGPHAMWGPGEFTMWHEFQVLCGRGFGVAYCNPRGSGGYGTPFTRTIIENWGVGPAGDVLAMADAASLLEWVDRDRLVLTGGSYGGYLTAWIVAHDHRFKAAVAQRGVYELSTFFGEGNAFDLVPREMGGYPWDARTRGVLDRESPFTDVHRIRTPLLITHASNDMRTGVSQSQMLYRALKVLGRPVEYVRFPNAGHDLSRTGDPLQRLDRLGRIVEFFERSLAAEP